MKKNKKSATVVESIFNPEDYNKITSACYKLISKLPINESDVALLSGMSHSDLIKEFYFSYDEALIIQNQLKLECNRIKHQKNTFKINENKQNTRKFLKECGCQQKSSDFGEGPLFGSLPLKSIGSLGSLPMSSRPSSQVEVTTQSESSDMKSALYSIIQDANELLTQMNLESDLPEWTQEKVWTAKDRLSAVKYFLKSNQGFNYE